MIKVRKAGQRGHADHGWLDTYHSFSFADYYDPAHMGFRSLRVINEDFVAPCRGFETHGHKDMEIITYVLDGALEHKDSLGTGSVIRRGEVQRMSAGTGIQHSEYNPSQRDPLHLLQIWILPEKRDLEPGYEQKEFPQSERQGKLRVLASRDGRDGSLRIHQDASLSAALLAGGQKVTHALGADRHAWVQVARGSVNLNGSVLETGDGAAVTGENEVTLSGNASSGPAEVLLFDLA